MPQPFWFSDLHAANKGPNWILYASFMQSSSVLLHEVFCTLTPQGFTYYRATHARCPIHWGWCDYDLYVDNKQYEAVIANLEDRQNNAIFVYHTMQVCQSAFQIERGYGGYPGQHGSEETRCIRTLAQIPNLIMGGWNIYYGGVVYQYEAWSNGHTSTELLTYLDK